MAGAPPAEYRQQKQAAEESRFRLRQSRDSIRQEVKTSFYELLKNNRLTLPPPSREVISSAEALGWPACVFQPFTTQREVVGTASAILTNAEVRTRSVTDYKQAAG